MVHRVDGYIFRGMWKKEDEQQRQTGKQSGNSQKFFPVFNPFKHLVGHDKK